MRIVLFGAVIAALAVTGAVRAAETARAVPIGEPRTVNDISIAAAYLAPVDMDPPGMDLPASQSDIHLETDIRALPGNASGFAAGEWVAYLTVGYRFENTDTGKTVSGSLMPMLESAGPHYGANIKMPGVGHYKLTLHIEPPGKQGMAHHVDKATGTGKWPQPFDVDFRFQYVPLAK